MHCYRSPESFPESGPNLTASSEPQKGGTLAEVRERNQVYIAEHGRWNRTQPLGYRVSLVKMTAQESIQATQPLLMAGCRLMVKCWHDRYMQQ